MLKFSRVFAYGGAMAALGLTVPAKAVSLVATQSNFASVFAQATGGDTIIMNGSFGALTLANRSFNTPLRIDARNASFNGTLSIRRMSGLSVIGGRFGNGTGTWQNGGTIAVYYSQHIGFTRPILTGDALGGARGLTFVNTNGFSVTDGSFSGFRLAMGATGSTNGTFTSNRITRSTSDGINIVDSHRITARGNSCSGGIPSVGAHPDCIQLWSISGKPPQSDIRLLYNTATGSTQGFTSFDPSAGGGLRISMIGNRVDTSFPQGIACYGCVDSIITDNVLTTQPGARWQTRINVIGGRNNIVANNSVGALPAPPPIIPGECITCLGTSNADVAGLLAFEEGGFGGELDNDFTDWAALTAVPETATWLQLLTGFLLMGSVVRRRSGQMLRQKAG